MGSYHRVRQGECLSSIARKYGFGHYQAIYDHPRNARLKQKRPNPNILYPGDEVFIPEKERKAQPCTTEQRHKFQVLKEQVLLRIVLQNDQGQAYANKKYRLRVADTTFDGTTDSEGLVTQRVPSDGDDGELTLWLSEKQAESSVCTFALQIGHLDPVEEAHGVQARLNNLGFDCGEVDGIIGPRTEAAIRAFQKRNQMPMTGAADSATRKKLRQLHDGT